VVIQIKALACELPFDNNVPLSRFSARDIAMEAVQRGIVAQISGTTIWRWLNEDAIKPWQYRSWIFPRDPLFEQKAGCVLDLYHGIWEKAPLKSDEFVICADEKTSVQVRDRKHKTLPVQKGQSMKVEHEYRRGGSLNYIAAWDINRAKIFGRCEDKTGIKPFDRLVSDVMSQEPYRSAPRIFLIVDNGSSHRGQSSVNRIQEKWPQIVLVHLPIHASWLNQIEIYFSIVQRKILTPNYFTSINMLKETIQKFQKRYEKIAKPFEWKFNKNDLDKLLRKLIEPAVSLKLSA
jgi:hypothetical protein